MRAALLVLFETMVFAGQPSSDQLLKQEETTIYLVRSIAAEYAYYEGRYPTWEELVCSWYMEHALARKEPKFVPAIEAVKPGDAQQFLPGPSIRWRLSADRQSYSVKIERERPKTPVYFCSNPVLFYSSDRGKLERIRTAECSLQVKAGDYPSQTKASNTFDWVKPRRR